MKILLILFTIVSISFSYTNVCVIKDSCGMVAWVKENDGYGHFDTCTVYTETNNSYELVLYDGGHSSYPMSNYSTRIIRHFKCNISIIRGE